MGLPGLLMPSDSLVSKTAFFVGDLCKAHMGVQVQDMK